MKCFGCSSADTLSFYHENIYPKIKTKRCAEGLMWFGRRQEGREGDKAFWMNHRPLNKRDPHPLTMRNKSQVRHELKYLIRISKRGKRSANLSAVKRFIIGPLLTHQCIEILRNLLWWDKVKYFQGSTLRHIHTSRKWLQSERG